MLLGDLFIMLALFKIIKEQGVCFLLVTVIGCRCILWVELLDVSVSSRIKDLYEFGVKVKKLLPHDLIFLHSVILSELSKFLTA